jgi:hypothetical protein
MIDWGAPEKLTRQVARNKNQMIVRKLILCCTGIAIAGQAFAQVELKTYADRGGYLDVQKLTCAQLASASFERRLSRV